LVAANAYSFGLIVGFDTTVPHKFQSIETFDVKPPHDPIDRPLLLSPSSHPGGEAIFQALKFEHFISPGILNSAGASPSAFRFAFISAAMLGTQPRAFENHFWRYAQYAQVPKSPSRTIRDLKV